MGMFDMFRPVPPLRCPNGHGMRDLQTKSFANPWMREVTTTADGRLRVTPPGRDSEWHDPHPEIVEHFTGELEVYGDCLDCEEELSDPPRSRIPWIEFRLTVRDGKIDRIEALPVEWQEWEKYTV